MNEEVLVIPVKDLWDYIKKETDDNPYVYEDDQYLKDEYPTVFTVKELIKKYSR